MNLHSHHQIIRLLLQFVWLFHRSKKSRHIAALLKLGLKKILEPRTSGSENSFHGKKVKIYQNNQNYTLLYAYIDFWCSDCFDMFFVLFDFLEYSGTSSCFRIFGVGEVLYVSQKIVCIFYFHPTWGDLTPSASLPSCPDMKLYTECRRGNPENGWKWRLCQRNIRIRDGWIAKPDLHTLSR